MMLNEMTRALLEEHISDVIFSWLQDLKKRICNYKIEILIV